jgi:hypothetical protein
MTGAWLRLEVLWLSRLLLTTPHHASFAEMAISAFCHNFPQPENRGTVTSDGNKTTLASCEDETQPQTTPKLQRLVLQDVGEAGDYAANE